MPEKKDPPYLLLFLLLSLLLHLSLAYQMRDWQPLSQALKALTREKKKEIPVQIIELPREKKEKVEPPPEKPRFLADRNQQSPENIRSREQPPASKPLPAKAEKPVPPPRKTAPKPKPTAEKAKPAPAKSPPARKPVEPRAEIPAPRKPEPTEAEKPAEKPVEPKPRPLEKLFPTFEELTRQAIKEPPAARQQQPRLPREMQEGTELSLNTLDYKFHSYYLALKRKIELVWEYPLQARMNGLQGRLLMRFIINRDGSLAEIKILRSSGSPYLDHEAVRAVKAASPFPPLPERMQSKTLTVTATFEYSLSYRSVY